MSILMGLKMANEFLSDRAVQRFDERKISLNELHLWELINLRLTLCETEKWRQILRMS